MDAEERGANAQRIKVHSNVHQLLLFCMLLVFPCALRVGVAQY
jgi:hypothetical protein